MSKLIRRLYRTPLLIVWVLWQGLVSIPISYQKDLHKSILGMVAQTRIWGRGLLKIFGVQLVVHGDVESYRKNGGLLVSNHLGYLDIFVHGAIFGLRFAPKQDIRSWPFFGWYTNLTHPIWVDRDSRQSSTKLLEEFRTSLRGNIPLIVYPEGTSTDGNSGILPFKATTFETVVGTDIPIQPIVTVYTVEEGDTSPCWYGDLTLFPHVWALFGNRRVQADVFILPPIYPEGRSRKELASYCRERMLAEYNRIHEQKGS